MCMWVWLKNYNTTSLGKPSRTLASLIAIRRRRARINRQWCSTDRPLYWQKSWSLVHIEFAVLTSRDIRVVKNSALAWAISIIALATETPIYSIKEANKLSPALVLVWSLVVWNCFRCRFYSPFHHYVKGGDFSWSSDYKFMSWRDSNRE